MVLSGSERELSDAATSPQSGHIDSSIVGRVRLRTRQQESIID